MARGAYTAALFEDPDALPPPESHAPVLRTWTGVNRTCDEAHVRPLSSGATSVLPSAHDPRPSSQSWLCHRPDTALAALLDVAASHEEPSITVPSLAHTATVLPSAQSDARSSRKLRQTGTRPTVLFDPEMDQMHFGIEPLSLLGAIWLQLGMSLKTGVQFRPGAVCDRFIEIGLHATGSRADKVICSDACWAKKSRQKKNEERRKAATNQ